MLHSSEQNERLSTFYYYQLFTFYYLGVNQSTFNHLPFRRYYILNIAFERDCFNSLDYFKFNGGHSVYFRYIIYNICIIHFSLKYTYDTICSKDRQISCRHYKVLFKFSARNLSLEFIQWLNTLSVTSLIIIREKYIYK